MESWDCPIWVYDGAWHIISVGRDGVSVNVGVGRGGGIGPGSVGVEGK